MKTYGKEPESLEAIIPLFQTALAEFPTDAVMRAIDLHAQRSQEFPTRFDIVNLIKSRGRPPLSQAMYIAFSKKDYEDRTFDEQNYIRDYEEEMQEEDSGIDVFIPKAPTHDEHVALRQMIHGLRDENERLKELLHEARKEKGLERPKPTLQEKIDKTVTQMRATGASEQDIEQFLVSMKAA